MSISNQGDFVSGDEVVTEIERLKEEIDEKRDEVQEAKDADEENETSDPALLFELEDALDDLEQELKPLEELENDVFFSLSDVTLVSEDAFEEYMQRLAVDCGDVSEDSSVYAYIDWDRYAQDMQVDYTSVDFDGETFYYHS